MYYKVTDPFGKAQDGGSGQWSLPTQNSDGTWTPGDWWEVEGHIAMCKSGLHLTYNPWQYVKYFPGKGVSKIWEVEHSEIITTTSDKAVVRKARLLQPYCPDWWAKVVEFIESIPSIPWFQAVQPPDPEWKVFDTRDAARDATRGAAWNTVWDAAWNAAWNATRNASRDAAADAARNTAREAAADATKNIAWDVTWDAALLAICLVVQDINPGLLEYAQRRWQVWLMGYGLLADIDGTFYVYRRVV